MAKQVTKAQLAEQLEALRHNANLLEIENARLRAEIEALRKPAPAVVVAEPVVAKPVVAKPVVAKPVVAKPVVAKPVVAKPVASRPVFEFDPKIPGDFARAATLAREFRGSTRRCA